MNTEWVKGFKFNFTISFLNFCHAFSLSYTELSRVEKHKGIWIFSSKDTDYNAFKEKLLKVIFERKSFLYPAF